MSVVFIVQQLSQPRCIKRISAIQKAGIPIKVYGFDNGLYNSNLDKLPFSITAIIKRDKTVSRLKKIIFFIRTVKRIMNENSQNDLFYLFGFEIGIISYFLKCKRYVYEEADVSAARIHNSVLRKFLLMLDRSVILNSMLTIFTSQGFVKYIFEDIRPHNVIFVPNKLNIFFTEEKRLKLSNRVIDINHIKFGFIGLIRYPNTIIRFAKVIGREFPQHEFHFYGDVERKYYIDEEINNFSNVYFHGPFKNPTDLPCIYSNIDINVVCYDTRSGNVRIAEPNKLYESIFFETPIVVSKDTFLAERVKEYNIGESIDASSDKLIFSFVRSLKREIIDEYIQSCRSIPYNEVIDDSSEFLKRIVEYAK